MAGLRFQSGVQPCEGESHEGHQKAKVRLRDISGLAPKYDPTTDRCCSHEADGYAFFFFPHPGCQPGQVILPLLDA